MKKRLGIVTFILLLCIATISFATMVEKPVDIEEGETVFLDENQDGENTIEDEIIENAKGELVSPAVADSENTNTPTNTKKENIYHADSEDKYTLSENVVGNVFLAGNEIIINSQYIAGDVFVACNTVTISKDTVIDGNAYIAAQTINIDGSIYRTGYIAGKIIKLSNTSTIEYDAFIAGEKIELSGELSRSAYVFSGTLDINEGAVIGNDLVYEAEEEATIPEGAVKGEIKFNKISGREKPKSEVVLDYVKDLLGAIIFTVTVFIIVTLMSKKFNYKSQELLGKHALKSIGIGLFTLIIMPILAVILLVLNVTAGLGLAMIPAYILTILVANAITAISVASLICARSNGMKVPIVVPIIAAILWALEEIPVIGVIVGFISILIGIGILMQIVFSGNKPISQGETTKTEKEDKKDPKIEVKEETEENKEEVKEEKSEEDNEKEDDKSEEKEVVSEEKKTEKE